MVFRYLWICRVYGSDGPQPNGDGPQPNTDGLQPNTLSFRKNLGTKSFVRALLQGSFPRRP